MEYLQGLRGGYILEGTNFSVDQPPNNISAMIEAIKAYK
jgi:hypothetical protein